MSDIATLADKIARIKAIDFAGNPPESVARVLDIYLDLAGVHPLAELQRAIDQAVKNAKEMLAGGKRSVPPGSSGIACNVPAATEEAA